MSLIFLYYLPNPSCRTMALKFTQHLTENLSVGNEQPARKADNLTAIFEPIV
jgi:hypothetical protein